MYKAIGENVIIKKNEPKKEESGSIIIHVANKSPEIPTYTIVDISPFLYLDAPYKIGDIIMITPHSALLINEKLQLYCVPSEKILLRIENAS